MSSKKEAVLGILAMIIVIGIVAPSIVNPVSAIISATYDCPAMTIFLPSR